MTGLSPDTAYTVVMETSLGLGISHQVDITMMMMVVVMMMMMLIVMTFVIWVVTGQ